MNIFIAVDTSEESFKELLNQLREYTRESMFLTENTNMILSDILVDRLKVLVIIPYRQNWQDIKLKSRVQREFMLKLCELMEKLGIKFALPASFGTVD